jgi:hypothetical protein
MMMIPIHDDVPWQESFVKFRKEYVNRVEINNARRRTSILFDLGGKGRQTDRGIQNKVTTYIRSK